MYKPIKDELWNKWSRGRQAKELWNLCSCVARKASPSCIICGCEDNLHAHHIKPKGAFPHFKFDLRNIVVVCYRHHMGHGENCAHHDSTGFVQVLERRLGKAYLDGLDLLVHQPTTQKLDYGEIRKDLESKLRGC